MNNLEKLVILIYIQSKLNKNFSRNFKPKNIFFGGASWGSAFYIGVYQGLLEKYGSLNGINIYGVSAGALLALCMVLEMSPKELEEIYLDLANQADQNGVFFKMTKYHNDALDKILKDENSYKKVNGKLHIGISVYPNQHIIINEWNSNQELRHDLHCSFHIPYYCTYNAIKNGKLALDGALTFDQSLYPDDTLYIGMSNHHINSNLTTKECTYPILGEKYIETVKDGYNKTIKYDLKNYIFLKELKAGFLFPLKIWWFVKLTTKLIIK